MGQGLFTKVRDVVARELGIAPARIRVSASDTAKVPNASPTAASAGSDLNGMAARDAARQLKARLASLAASKLGAEAGDVVFAGDSVTAGGQSIAFADLARMAYFARVPLSATGFYATPKIHYDRKTLTGRPFFYFAYGAAVSEVVVDTLTGETRLLAVDILHDVGTSLNPAIDRGQVEGGFLQGYGWLTMEALWWNDRGELMTHSPSTYKIPTAREWPEAFRIDFLDAPNVEDTIHRSKAVGEPPFMLALSAFHAIRDAVASVADDPRALRLDAPATAEAVFRAVRALGANPPADRGGATTGGAAR
jgi:xanthine dehydrogenase large subunit